MRPWAQLPLPSPAPSWQPLFHVKHSSDELLGFDLEPRRYLGLVRDDRRSQDQEISAWPLPDDRHALRRVVSQRCREYRIDAAVAVGDAIVRDFHQNRDRAAEKSQAQQVAR